MVKSGITPDEVAEEIIKSIPHRTIRK